MLLLIPALDQKGSGVRLATARWNPHLFMSSIMTPDFNSKADLRQRLRQQRQSLNTAVREKNSHDIIQQLTHSALFEKSLNIILYLPNDNEVDLTPLLTLHSDKNYFLPCLTPEKILFFKAYSSNADLSPNSLGIPEPTEGAIISAENADLVCVPLVGFSSTGERLGMGGGYYDRTFAFKIKQPKAKPYLLGIAYEFQKVENLPHSSWDVKLDGIITEHGFHQP